MAFTGVRGRVGALLSSLGVAADEPQELARRLSISRNLTWKVSKVLCMHDLYQALAHLPGEEGLEILWGAMERVGIAKEMVSAARDAHRRLDEVVRVHIGDRGSLEIFLDSMGTGDAGVRLEQSRKLAFRGASGIWGVQARAKTTTMFVAPSANEPDKLDTAMVGGIVDFRRLRPGIRWPLFAATWYHDDGSPWTNLPREIAVDEAYEEREGPKLIGDMLSPSDPPIRVVKRRTGLVYELEEGPIGNTGALTCFYGTIAPAGVTRYKSASDEFGECNSLITLPVELVQVDLVAHRSLEHVLRPSVHVLGSVGIAGSDQQEIPVGERPIELSGRPPVMATPLVPRYEEMIDRVMRRAGWNRSEFAAIRLTVPYPPMHSTVMLRFVLEERR